jgi:hypothetical protein
MELAYFFLVPIMFAGLLAGARSLVLLLTRTAAAQVRAPGAGGS